VNSQENHVEIGVDFSNVTAEDEYEYEIWFTRVDPDYKHQSFIGNIEPEYGGTTYRVERTWTPSQDGPYTVHCVVRPSTDDPDWDIANGNDTFGWGDVANNSLAPNAEITPDPERTHYDLFGNTSLADAVTIELDAVGTESGAAYNIRWKLYKEGVNESLIGQKENTQHRNFVMTNFIDYFENNSNYTLTSWLLRMDQSSTGEPTENVVGSDSWSFAIGEEPDVSIEPVISGCMDENATNYDENATVDDGSCEFDDTDGDGIFDHLEVEGCTDSNASNFDQNATDDDGSCEFDDTDGDGIFDHLEVEGCTNSNASNFDQNATDDDGSCVFDDTDGDGVFDHLEVEGCTDSQALNFDAGATESDGSCVYPVPLSVTLETNRTTGDAPLVVAFVANSSGGESPYEIEWDFGDGTVSNLAKTTHTFAAGVHTVVLQITDDAGETVEQNVQIVASEPPEIANLTGYFTDSGQLAPINDEMFASIEFTASANGGEGPYTFSWEFGDGNENVGSPVLHEYAKNGTYTVQLTIEDSEGRSLLIEQVVSIVNLEDENQGEISPVKDDMEDGGGNFDLYVTSSGAIGLLMIFGLFGRKRREGFLEAERRKARGEGSIWED
jgi:PKD repeat protein